MSFKHLVKRALRPIARPLLDAIAARVGARANLQGVGDKVEFDLRLMATLRSLATGGDHHVRLPHESAQPQRDPKTIKIGFFGNIANNAYNFTKCLRRLGYDAELVVEDGVFDAFLLNRPFWEDVEVECGTYEEGLPYERVWIQPDYVRRVAYDAQMQVRFQGRYSAVPEVQAMYQEAFGTDLPSDRALLLAQHMGHWPYLLAMKRYDVVQFSGAPISMGAFCPKPYVVFPTGSDLFIAPFQETVLGMLMRLGYRNAEHLIVCETNYPEYLDRLELSVPRSFVPLMVDTDTYAPGTSDEVRAKWMEQVGGKRFLLSVCRQSWEWKGNDRMVRAFRALTETEKHKDWRLVLTQWGPDVGKTKQLITELGLDGKVFWEALTSKPRLRKRQQAADLIADQFVMPGYGTSVVESMAAGKAVLLAASEWPSSAYLPQQPPFIRAANQDEIVRALSTSADDDVIVQRGKESLQWVHACHSYLSVSDSYVTVYRSVLGLSPSCAVAPSGTERYDTVLTSPHHSGTSFSSRRVLHEFLRLHQELRQAIKDTYNRSVPLAEELTDRWERARFLGFGDKTSIYDSALVLGDVRVGRNTWIGPNCILDGSGGLEIGSHCSIASGCHIYSHDTVEWALSGGKSAYQRKPTRIGDACYLGPHSVVTAGVTIGDHCLIGALSLVNRDVPDNTIVAGTPARVIGSVKVGPDCRITLHYQEKDKTDKP